MARKDPLVPAAIDQLELGRICDPLTPGLRIEALRSGRKRWKFRRRLPGTSAVIKMHLGCFPVVSIAEARQWASRLNEEIDAGIDPRNAIREEAARTLMTVDRAHALYMEAVREGRSSRAKRPNKPRTIEDKLAIYNRDIAPSIGRKSIYEVSEEDLILLSYLARADGHVCDMELDQIEIFLDHVAVDEGERCPSRTAIETMAFGLAPDWTSASLACSELSGRPDRAQQVWRAVRKIVDADSFLHAREQELVAEVQSALRVA